MRATLLLVAPFLVLFTQGCGSSLAQPFDQMKSAPVTVYRLQNFEPPAQAAAAQIQLPPQIQQWIQQGAAMLPPGLIPPGLIPGAAATPAAPTADAMRFHGFRVLGWKQIGDTKTHDEVLDLFGHESSFVTQHEGCMFAEFGFQIAQTGPAPADILVSLSCSQAAAAGGFQWPYAKNGISPDTAKKISSIVQATFGGT